MEYACPICKKRLLVFETAVRGFTFKLICGNCSFLDYVPNLEKLTEYITVQGDIG